MLTSPSCRPGRSRFTGTFISRPTAVERVPPGSDKPNPTRDRQPKTGGFLFMTHYRTDDVRIEQGDELLAPMQVMRELPPNERALATTFEGRKAIHDIL